MANKSIGWDKVKDISLFAAAIYHTVFAIIFLSVFIFFLFSVFIFFSTNIPKLFITYMNEAQDPAYGWTMLVKNWNHIFVSPGTCLVEHESLSTACRSVPFID